MVPLRIHNPEPPPKKMRDRTAFTVRLVPLLKTLRKRAMTAGEAAALNGALPRTYKIYAQNLSALGMIEEVGLRKAGAHHYEKVWRITPAGREKIRKGKS